MLELTQQPTVGHDVSLTNATLGSWTEIGDRCTLENVVMGDYSYCGADCIVQNTEIGKFSNIAAHVRLGPTAHPLDRPTLHHFTYRRAAYGFAATDDEAFFAADAHKSLCEHLKLRHIVAGGRIPGHAKPAKKIHAVQASHHA